MATGLDELIEHLLSEVALCGNQGAGSKDFQRFIHAFYQNDNVANSGSRLRPRLPLGGLDRTFYEKLWTWVATHSDIRIIHSGQTCQYSLSDFEAAEPRVAGVSSSGSIVPANIISSLQAPRTIQPHGNLLGLCEPLRQRLLTEGPRSRHSSELAHPAMPATSSQRHTRQQVEDVEMHAAVFDEPASTITAPRLYASQNRIWQALTGHSMDLKKVPSMEFALLSLIAASGAKGITQPELTQFSGQDKRSVPHRTDELARKGYIVKNPVQAGKARTSICVHSKFVNQNHFTASGAVEDVFQEGKFVASGFIPLLYSKLKDAGVVPTREIRKRLGVPIRTWNKRAVQGCIIRLDQTGFIKRFRVRKNNTEDSWVICIQIQREPQPEDLENLGFRRQAAIADTSDELLHDDGDGDTLMRDLEIDMLDDGTNNEGANDLDADFRIPPQWTPDRLLANTIYDFTVLGRAVGWDAIVLRDRVVGPFWRRPMESQLTRLTDDWERMQPPHIRHLAIIRDTRNTAEKRFIHYVYRTYKHFAQAVEAGEALWAGVCKPATKTDAGAGQLEPHTKANPALDAWGFSPLNQKDFIRFNGTASLSDVRSAIVGPRKYGPRWDIALAEEIGYRKLEAHLSKVKGQQRPKHVAVFKGEAGPDNLQKMAPQLKKPNKTEKAKKKGSGLTLTPEERIALGLKPTGRLSKRAAQQILAHRRESGDPTSLPETIVEKPVVANRAPLMTKEERAELGLPVKGRLGLDKENEIREKRGLPKLVAKGKRKSAKKDAPILTKQQRIALGLKDHGRLHQHFVDALRKEQDDEIPLEKSPAVDAYREFLKAEAAKEAARKARTSGLGPTPSGDEALSRSTSEVEQTTTPENPLPEHDVRSLSPAMIATKRKAASSDISTPISKRQRTHEDILREKAVEESAASVHCDQSPQGDASNALPSGTLIGGSIEHTDTATVSSSHQHTPTPYQPLQPVVSDIISPLPAKQAKSAENEVTVSDIERYSPGLYIYPSAKCKTGRGRPRNAFIIMFKSARLAELPWFNDTSIEEDNLFQITSIGALRSAGLGLKSETVVGATPQASASEMPSLVEERSLILPYLGLPIGQIDVLQEQDKRREFPQLAAAATRVTETISVATVPSPTQSNTRPIGSLVSNTTAQLDSSASPSHQLRNFRKAMGSNNRASPLRAVAGSNASVASDRVALGYQSPYGPGSLRISPVRLEDTAGNFSLRQSAPANGDAIDIVDDTVSLSQGVVGTIANCGSTVKPKKPTVRSSGPGITGSGVRFRREIILEIIDRCGGVYPLHGEIWRPFSALWDQRHGHTNMKKPESSTVFDTLKNMISNPVFGLKRMTFLIKARNALGARPRNMVAKADMAPDDPKVRKLAHNMANHALDKSRQFFPEEIREFFEMETLYVPVPIAPKVDTLTLENLGISIEENKARRRQEKIAQKKREKEAARKQNEQVEQVASTRRTRGTQASSQVVPRARRARLASLNDKNKRYRRAAVQSLVLKPLEEFAEATDLREPSPSGSTSSEEVPLISVRPLLSEIVEYGSDDDEPSPHDQIDEDGELESEPDEEANCQLSTPTSGTFSTRFNIIMPPLQVSTASQADKSSEPKKPKKRVRIDVAADLTSRKNSRTSCTTRDEVLDEEFVYSSVEDSDATSSEDDDDDDDDEVELRPKVKQTKRTRVSSKRQLGKKLPPPTLLERLTGLTGDPNDPIYTDPKQQQRPGHGRPWAEKKKKQSNKLRKERNYATALDYADEFKKLFYTLVLASLMSGEGDRVEWGIVEKVFAQDKLFDLPRTKKLWTWMQSHMAAQVSELVDTYVSNMLAAYEAGKLPSILDPDVYDWAGLIRWTLRTCAYPNIPLPLHREAIEQLTVDESAYATLDRVHWYGKKVADTVRTQLQLHTSFVAPLYHPSAQPRPSEIKAVKARSWIRANIATPQDHYDSTEAHAKLKVLGEDILTRVVADYVQKEHLKMRKIKRQLPGRNYTFTKNFAKSYKRPFELKDFMVATTIKKELDSAFADDNPEMRFYSISRCEEDGAIMAITSLVSDGKVKLVPRLPPVDNDFGAPLPRLSKWGFCEGDYIHRAIDRNRMFWDVYAVPTSEYQFGNPLQPLSSPATDWPSLPDPPLPGKDDPEAILPIWSSIHGHTATWPWWYRILNLVLQPLFVQPGATVTDIHAHYAEHATEIFEVQLVLNWLESVGAISKAMGGGYQVTCNFWASFGDRLLDTDDDWFGQHVKRRTKSTTKQLWREKYNLRYSNMQARGSQRAGANVRAPRQNDIAPQAEGGAMSHEIYQNSRAQYRIIQQAMLEAAPQPLPDGDQPTAFETLNSTPAHCSQPDERTPADDQATTPPDEILTTVENGSNMPDQDQHMEDVDDESHATGEDVDAEGDIDVDDLDPGISGEE
ncbi:hypothetical protein EK21DRAFT_77007 [Setomelanomma holmii]|uniref:B-block binding subunit of TFIIIC domain-containing protein n=1 Tax=Setomelanomma holmii TaxID=210430 RepID=A0A9P4LI37_9PLEO|nr:hypothetical protein EK21DRAFT_77007 [Setomelanomma holmii]